MLKYAGCTLALAIALIGACGGEELDDTDTREQAAMMGPGGGLGDGPTYPSACPAGGDNGGNTCGCATSLNGNTGPWSLATNDNDFFKFRLPTGKWNLYFTTARAPSASSTVDTRCSVYNSSTCSPTSLSNDDADGANCGLWFPEIIVTTAHTDLTFLVQRTAKATPLPTTTVIGAYDVRLWTQIIRENGTVGPLEPYDPAYGTIGP